MSELDNNIRKLTSLIDGKFSGRAGFCNEVDQLRALLKLQLVRAENLCAVLPETYLPAAVPIPIAVGESLYTKHEFAEYLRSGAVDIIQADVCRVGGISEWMKIAHLAHAWDIQMAPHVVYELSVSLLCAVQNGLIAEMVSGGSVSELGLLVETIRPEDGWGVPPKRPGHGVVFDEQALARYAV